ncbi:DUF1822 family protein [Nodosilinea sp. LEGE 07088]|uniref:DUF1822 family protein n=1 Tax=Nodosilinea sp. LEGE 07088 TaxID=2777968 RepID=UPI001880184F|nr:DUF1822 family protein [Nodosilinea sp. LEGE 07088]MBE9140201.1 DUF1822 family protein [Nodosilinea sp. LEGE 07088]
MSHSTEPQDFEFEPLQSTTVTLSAADTQWATAICQQVSDPAQQWPTFLRAMALRGVQTWLGAGAQTLSLSYDLDYPPTPGIACQVNGLRLCLVAQGSLSDAVVTIPPGTLDNDENFAHLYLLAEVRDETDQVTILAGLRRDRLLAYQHQTQLATNADGTYTVPVRYFDTAPAEILLYLKCLNPEQLTVPAAGLTLADSSPRSPGPARAWAGDLINAGRWLRDQLDTVAETLAWTLLPPLAPANALMPLPTTPAEQLEAVLRELEPAGITIPPTARGAYTDLQQLGLPLRLYALTWTIFDNQPPEWSLFLFLGPLPGQQLVPGTRLLVNDATTTLVEQTLTQDTPSSYLYAQVIGTWDEQFTATVALPNGSTLNWPPFVFRPEAPLS